MAEEKTKKKSAFREGVDMGIMAVVAVGTYKAGKWIGEKIVAGVEKYGPMGIAAISGWFKKDKAPAE